MNYLVCLWTNEIFTTRTYTHNWHLFNNEIRMNLVKELHFLSNEKKNCTPREWEWRRNIVQSLPDILIHRHVFRASRLTMHAKNRDKWLKKSVVFMCSSTLTWFFVLQIYFFFLAQNYRIVFIIDKNKILSQWLNWKRKIWHKFQL